MQWLSCSKLYAPWCLFLQFSFQIWLQKLLQTVVGSSNLSFQWMLYCDFTCWLWWAFFHLEMRLLSCSMFRLLCSDLYACYFIVHTDSSIFSFQSEHTNSCRQLSSSSTWTYQWMLYTCSHYCLEFIGAWKLTC